jgi:hypothetical protein
MSLLQSLVFAVILLLFIFVLVGGIQAPRPDGFLQLSNDIAKWAISGAFLVAFLAFVIKGTSRR